MQNKDIKKDEKERKWSNLRKVYKYRSVLDRFFPRVSILTFFEKQTNAVVLVVRYGTGKVEKFCTYVVRKRRKTKQKKIPCSSSRKPFLCDENLLIAFLLIGNPVRLQKKKVLLILKA